MSYAQFVGEKAATVAPAGFRCEIHTGPMFDFQRRIVEWALWRGRAAVFADCGLGKALMALEWATRVAEHTGGRVIILAPLAVAEQIASESVKFSVAGAVVSRGGDNGARIVVTNYEQSHRFDLPKFAGIVLDESSILKNHTGATRTELTERCGRIPFKLCCTATPAPNDHTELGTHAEFLGICTRAEMLASYFVHDGGETAIWRLKRHAVAPFFQWVASWAVAVRRPSDIGFDADGYDLPALNLERIIVDAPMVQDGLLLRAASTLAEVRVARRQSMADRIARAASIVNASDEQWVVWGELNDECDAAESAMDGAEQVAGADSDDDKVAVFGRFQTGATRVLVSKPKIAGFGLNWQHCRNMIFLGASHSYEQFYQAIRRCWRFGQPRDVRVVVMAGSAETSALDSLERKHDMAETMVKEMVGIMADVTKRDFGTAPVRDAHKSDTTEMVGDGWTATLGDCVDAVRAMPSDSVGFTVFSPPFASLYTYSADPRDMGNCATHEDFYAHFRFLVPELLRVTKPGRLLSFHCMNLQTLKERDGYIGIMDFRGNLIRLFQDAGWIYHSEVCIWKDPVTAMQRTKALGLLHKQIKKDSCMSRQGIPDYLVTMRKPGDNPERVTHTDEDFPVSMWQRYASPVWMDINPSDTLQKESARDHEDERHICPLQLDVTRRALKMWSNPGDLVLSPFMGIGSEGYVALKEGRRFHGVELKPSYYAQAVANLAAASDKSQLSLL